MDTLSDPHPAAGDSTGPAREASRVLAAAALFGTAFGFLLQKGGVAKFDVLIGVLLLEHLTVVKVMGTAIAVGIVAVAVLRRAGVLELEITPAPLRAAAVGGLVFGAGFGMVAYCPGTMAAALGQGNLDALPGMVGLVVGSYLYAVVSARRSGRGSAARLTEVVPGPPVLVSALVVAALVGALLVIERLGG